MRRLEDHLNNLVFLIKKLADKLLNVRGITEVNIIWKEHNQVKTGTLTRFYNYKGEVKNCKFFNSVGEEIPRPENWSLLLNNKQLVNGESLYDEPKQLLLENDTIIISNPSSITYTAVKGIIKVKTPDGNEVSYPINDMIYGTSFHGDNLIGNYEINARGAVAFITYTMGV